MELLINGLHSNIRSNIKGRIYISLVVQSARCEARSDCFFAAPPRIPSEG